MKALRDQQRALQHAIVHRRDAPSLLRNGTTGAAMLVIYQHAYRARLTAALRDNFGVLPQVMGDAAFDDLAAAYVAEHPSRHPSIRWLGHRLAEFMAERQDLVPHPALRDLARMEWALRGAFDAADAAPLQATALSALAPEEWPRLVVEPVPSAHALRLQWAIEPLWRALQSMEAGHDPELPEPQAHPHTLLIWRQGLENRWRSLKGLHAQLLHAMLEGQCFATLCLLAAHEVGENEAAQAAVSALQCWLADGLIAGWRLAPAHDDGTR